MSEAVHSKLTKFYIGADASPIVYTHVKEMLGVPPVVQEAPELDVTSLDSPAREYIGALSVGDELPLEFNWIRDDPGQVAMGAAKIAGTATPFRVDFPDGTRLEFSAVVRSFGPGAAVDEQIKGASTLKISGLVEQSSYEPTP